MHVHGTIPVMVFRTWDENFETLNSFWLELLVKKNLNIDSVSVNS